MYTLNAWAFCITTLFCMYWFSSVHLQSTLFRELSFYSFLLYICSTWEADKIDTTMAAIFQTITSIPQEYDELMRRAGRYSFFFEFVIFILRKDRRYKGVNKKVGFPNSKFLARSQLPICPRHYVDCKYETHSQTLY